MWFSFVALVAAYAPAGKIKGMLRHPMLVGVKVWALAHLLVNGDLGSLILFGTFLAWAVYDRIAVKRRGDPGAPRSGVTAGDAIAVVVGSVAYVAMFWLHPWLIGVPIAGSVRAFRISDGQGRETHLPREVWIPCFVSSVSEPLYPSSIMVRRHPSSLAILAMRESWNHSHPKTTT